MLISVVVVPREKSLLETKLRQITPPPPSKKNYGFSTLAQRIFQVSELFNRNIVRNLIRYRINKNRWSRQKQIRSLKPRPLTVGKPSTRLILIVRKTPLNIILCISLIFVEILKLSVRTSTQIQCNSRKNAKVERHNRVLKHGSNFAENMVFQL